MGEQLLLSVRLMVYNNENYIRQAVKSILMQVTNFHFEVVIGDDFSTDDTLKILKEYSSTDKITIRILKREIGGEYWKKRNHKDASVRTNFIDIVSHCKGKYIALLDGDDYWTDPLKLQKQVDFLEKNKQYSFCSTKYYQLKNDNLVKIYLKENETLKKNIFFKNRNATASLMFRSDVIHSSFRELDFQNIKAADWLLQSYACVKFNKGFILNDFTTVYRIHDNGIWSNYNTKQMGEAGVEVLRSFKRIFNDKESVYLISKAISLRKKEFGLDFISRTRVELRKKIFKVKKKFNI
jgi:glycosyltransferase involved in cell wall biosynthesis